MAFDGGRQMKIPFQDLREKSWLRRRALKRAGARVIDSGHYVLGSEVSAFERDFANSIGSRFVIGTGNGMDAIEIGLRALGVKPGDEVITTPLTAFATVLAIFRAGATPVLADINPDTGLLDPEEVRKLISSRTRAVVVVHLYGQIRDMPLWQDLADEYSIHLVEDCAQAHFASSENKSAGTSGAFGAFSFYPTKNLGAYGDAGAISTDSSEIAERAGQLRNYGATDRYVHDLLGMNSRLDEIQAAILGVRLRTAQTDVAKRRAIGSIYRERIYSQYVSLLEAPRSVENHSYHLFVVRSAHRAELAHFLLQRGVGTLVHYPYPVHFSGAWKREVVERRPLPASEEFASQVLSLPCRPGLRLTQASYIADLVNGFHPK